MYPDWLKEGLRKKYDELKKYNPPPFTMLRLNPHYELVRDWDTLEIGQTVVVGTFASTEAGAPNIRWQEYTLIDKPIRECFHQILEIRKPISSLG